MNPEKLSSIVRGFWAIMSALCAFGALGAIAFDNPERAVALALGGLAFYAMSRWRHDDIDIF